MDANVYGILPLEINAYLEKLQQSNGLFYHGENTRFFWGRGNGWVATGLAELLTQLPKTNKYYENIKTAFIKMMNALEKHQCNDVRSTSAQRTLNTRYS